MQEKLYVPRDAVERALGWSRQSFQHLRTALDLPVRVVRLRGGGRGSGMAHYELDGLLSWLRQIAPERMTTTTELNLREAARSEAAIRATG